MEYTEFTLKTGKIVHIRPQSWDEWMQVSESELENRLKLEKLASDGAGETERTLAAFRMNKELMESVYDHCVMDWQDVKVTATPQEVSEISSLIESVSAPHVESGN